MEMVKLLTATLQISSITFTRVATASDGSGVEISFEVPTTPSNFDAMRVALRDYMNDLEMIVFVTLEDLGLPELAVEKVMLFYGYVGQEEVEGDKEVVWNAFWVDTWDTESEVEAQEWYRVEQIRHTAEASLFYVYHKVTDTEVPSLDRSQYRWHRDYYFLVNLGL